MSGMQDRRIGRGNGRPSRVTRPAATATLAMLCFACGCTNLVTIYSEPPGARCYIDGELRGWTPVVTPVESRALKRSPTVRLEKEGYRSYEAPLRKKALPYIAHLYLLPFHLLPFPFFKPAPVSGKYAFGLGRAGGESVEVRRWSARWGEVVRDDQRAVVAEKKGTRRTEVAARKKAYSRVTFAEKESLVRAAEPERWARRKRKGRRGKQVMAIGIGVAALGLATAEDAPMPGLAMGMAMGRVTPGAIILLVGAAFPDYDDYINRQSRKLMVGVGPTGASLAYRF